MRLVAVKGPLKVIAPVVSVSTTVLALTAPLKVAPPELAIVRVPISVPMVPDTVSAPIVLIVRFEGVPPVVPAIDERLIALAIPVPRVSVTPSASVVAPKVMVPVELPPRVVSAETLTGLVPKLITPLEAAIVPAKVLVLGAVAVNPLLIVNVPPDDPNARVPVLLNVTALAIIEPLALIAIP